MWLPSLPLFFSLNCLHFIYKNSCKLFGTSALYFVTVCFSFRFLLSENVLDILKTGETIWLQLDPSPELCNSCKRPPTLSFAMWPFTTGGHERAAERKSPLDQNQLKPNFKR